VAALQLLPPRQRAVLILRDVLRWSAADVAELLETSVVSVKSALQRARATLATSGMAGSDQWTPAVPVDGEHQALLDRYVDAVERWDVDALVALLHEDATLDMPPHALWLQGAASIHGWFQNKHHELRVLPTAANGSSALGVYRAHQPGGPYEPFHLQVVEVSAGRITAIHSFFDPSRGCQLAVGGGRAAVGLFRLFDLPARLDG
jgi:RNA polymerase sigma-70 factor (ECF subfamily)